MLFHMISINGAPPELVGEDADGVRYRLDTLYRRASDSAVTIRAERVTLDSLLRSNDPVTAARWLMQRVERTPALEGDEVLKWDVPLRLGDVIGVGRNYKSHAEELNNPVPEEPVLFMKPRSSLLAHEQAIHLPPESARVDFEGELALVIGKRLQGKIAESEARKALFGVTLLNDVTDRATQSRLKKEGKPWLVAKGRPTFCPVGPGVKVLERGEQLEEFTIETRVNGEVRQSGNPGQWIFPAIDLIRHLAVTIGLQPGDLVATGTPDGVGPLQPGDTVEVFCPGIGILRNPVLQGGDV